MVTNLIICATFLKLLLPQVFLDSQQATLAVFYICGGGLRQGALHHLVVNGHEADLHFFGLVG